MIFLSPAILGFLALATIPVVLWLLFRRRKNEVKWGATYILRLTLQSKKKQNLWKQLIIITLRTILIALLVLAFARPFKKQDPATGLADFPRGVGTLHRVVLFDNSASMTAKSGPLSRLDQARQTLAALLAATKSGDICHVIPLCPNTAGVAAPIEVPGGTAAAKVSALLAPLEVSSRPLNFATGLRAAIQVLRDQHPDQRQLIVLSDLGRADHKSIADYEVYGTMLDSLGVRVATLNLTDKTAGNLAVESLTAGSERFFAGQSTNVYVDLMNYSDTPGDDGTLTFLVDGEAIKDVPVSIPPGISKTYVFPVELAAGDHRLEAKLGPDAFPADNSIERFVHASDTIRLLVISPKETAEGFERESEFLRRLLATSQNATCKLQTQISMPDQVLPKDIEDRDIVMLASLSTLTKPMVIALESWVRRGGGLVIAVGSGTEAQPFNDALGGLLPAKITTPFREKFDEERYVSIQPSDLVLPLLREFEDSANGNITSAKIYNYFQVAPPAEGAVKPRTLIALSNSDPLVLERSLGNGHVIEFTSPLNGAWSSLPVTQAYVPLLYRLFTFAASNAAPPRNLAMGEPIIANVTGRDGDLFVTTPDAQLTKLVTTEVAGRRFVRFEATQTPGRYDLQDATGKLIASFSVARPTLESDLRTLDAAQSEAYSTAMRSAIADSSEGLKKSLWREGDGKPSAAWVFLAALLVLVFDLVLTWIWFS